MARLPQIGDDIATRFRDMERRLAELEARARTGVIPGGRHILTSNSAGFTATTDTDFTLTVSTDATRLYKANVESQWFMSTTGTWSLEFRVDGVDIGRLGGVADTGGSQRGWASASFLWLPSTGSHTCVVRANKAAGAATFTLEATAATARMFWIEDAGPR